MYLIFDCSSISKPSSYSAPFSDTFNWSRMIHLSWIILDKNYKPLKDFDCIVKPEGFPITKVIEKRCRIDKEDVNNKGEELSDILKQFNESLTECDYVFAHNLNFNENIVAAEYLRKGIDHTLFEKERFCLMQESTYFCKIPNKRGSGYKWPSLSEMHSILFEKLYSPPNNARADVIAATRCFIKLMKMNQLSDLWD